jgi:acyl-CoA reductase-like NAD-dependent aldehyde dehydrogenase
MAIKPPTSRRLQVAKTYKLFLGGLFPRSESGRVLPASSPSGGFLANYSHASRKDFRDAVVKARSAFDKWSGTTAYLKGQILYRTAEMLETRAGSVAACIEVSTGVSAAEARKEVETTVDLLVHYAGWADKYQRLASMVNPVATSHFNFSVPEPTGVVAVFCPSQPSLLALAGLLAPVIVSGNAAVVMASESFPLPAMEFAEVLATSDLPGGVVNILTGPHGEIVPYAASHLDVNAVVDGDADSEKSSKLEAGSAVNLKRYSHHFLSSADWWQKGSQPYWILDTVETKTAWHPIGV